MVQRVTELLSPALQEPGAVLVDATVGAGGHADALLAGHPSLQLIGVDRDPAALRESAQRLARYASRVRLRHAVYDRIPELLQGLGMDRVDAVLFDLGLSSLQVDNPARGFSYRADVPLDMRMDPTTGRTAADVLNTYPMAELTGLLLRFGEERFARRIAGRVVRLRDRQPFVSTGQLVDVVRRAVPAPARRRGGHPAKRTFQALRIEVNDELGALQRGLPEAVGRLRIGGRIAVLSYQSLEDRLVKRTFADGAHRPAGPAPPGPLAHPDPAGDQPVLNLLTKGAERPSAEEVRANRRAASARLRAAERAAA